VTAERKPLEKIFAAHRLTDFRWIDPQRIVVAQWVRTKCMFGCAGYGHSACPPNTPSLAECERFLREYGRAVVFRFEKRTERPEDRHAWGVEVNQRLVALEREVFLADYPKAFMLVMDSCHLCPDCLPSRAGCRHARSSRPAPEAFGIDVFATVRQYDLPIHVVADYEQTMNRYAFLLIE
jgi:predicted metal-binding protein